MSAIKSLLNRASNFTPTELARISEEQSGGPRLGLSRTTITDMHPDWEPRALRNLRQLESAVIEAERRAEASVGSAVAS